MDKNIAAMLDQSAYTINVRYQHDESDGKPLTYVTNIQGIQAGDIVLVPTANRQPKAWLEGAMAGLHPLRATVAVVVSVDEDVMIEPNSDIKYHWVASKLDLTTYRQLMDRNAQVEQVIGASYKANVRRAFANEMLNCLPAEARMSIESSMGKAP